MIVHYKVLRWRWWVRPMVTLALWSRSGTVEGWVLRQVAFRGSYLTPYERTNR